MENEKKHRIASKAEWLETRLKLLEEEKELTKRSDEVTRHRMELPWVKVDKNYQFETEKGKVSLADLFEGRSQLIVYHFMLGPDYKAGCPSCSAIADGFNGIVVHLANHDVMFTAISRAPFSKVQAYKQRMGWTFPWASSFDSDFNFDFHVSFTEQQQRNEGIDYNYVHEPPTGDKATGAREIAQMAGTDAATFTRERPGMSTFIRQHGEIYHAYSAYARGLDSIWSMYSWLDRAPLGRNEDGMWWRRHDEY